MGKDLCYNMWDICNTSYVNGKQQLRIIHQRYANFVINRNIHERT